MSIPVVTLFSGVDGLSHAWDAKGFETTHQVEWDPNCQAILRRHFPHVNLLGDINHVHAADLGRPHVVVITFPCTDTSVGPPVRAGLAGTRSGQFFQAVRILHEWRERGEAPEWLVIENPDGLLGSNGGEDLRTVIRLLDELGYVGAGRVVDASSLGTPQRRRRILLVARLGGRARSPRQVLGLTGDGQGQAAAPRAQRAPWPAGPVPALPPGIAGFYRKSARPRAALSEGGYETWVSDGRTNTLTGFDWGNAARQTHWVLHEDGRMRGTTLREWERLQGLPDDWTEWGVDTHGNRIEIPEGDLRRNKVLIKAGRGTILGNMLHVGTADWNGDHLLAEIEGKAA